MRNKFIKRKLILFVAFAAMSAKALTFDWNPVVSPATNRVTGYVIQWGTNSLAVGNVTKATVTNLPPDTDLKFSIKAKTATGETALSDAIPYRTPSALSAPPRPPLTSNVVDRVTILITNGTFDVRTQKNIKP